MRALALALICGVTAACSYTPKKVAPMFSPSDLATLAADAAEFARNEYPAAATTLWLPSPTADETEIALFTALAPALRERGFAVAEGDAGRQLGAPALVLDARPVDEGVVALILLNGQLATRWYQRDMAALLVPASPMTVRNRQ